MASKINIGDLSSEVMRQLNEYADLTTEGMKTAVQNAGKTVQKEIKGTAPKDTGAYSKSWAVKKTSESSRALEVTVHSRNRYQLAHLLEHGHAKRGGGRVRAIPHIAPAEEEGVKELEDDIKEALEKGGGS